MSPTTADTATPPSLDGPADGPAALVLDDRQRAMLREMGVTVWLPRRAPVAVAAAAGAEVGIGTAPRAPAPAAPPPLPPPPPPPPPRPAPVPAPAPVQATVAAVPRPAATAGPGAVLRGDWHALSSAGPEDTQAPVWLVLTDAATADPREGDAGRLLDAMLRAAGLHRSARVWAASVGRPGEDGLPLADALASALAAHRPAMVLALGRLAAQSALGRTDPLGRLRGTVHAVGEGGVPLVASYEPAWLLRAQDDKARAWEDLCRALAAAKAPLESAP